MAQREAARRRCDRNGGDQRREQGDQCQEAVGAFQRALHLGPSALDRLDALAALQIVLQPSGERLHRCIVAGHEQAIRHSTARLNQCRCRQVGQIDQNARRKVDELDPAIRFDHDQAGDHQNTFAQPQRLAHVQMQSAHDLSVDPGRTRRRNVMRRLVGCRRIALHAQCAAQRISRRDSLQRNERVQFAVCSVQRHARKGHRIGDADAGARGARAQRIVDRPIRVENKIRAQHLARVALQAKADPIDEETDAGDCGHREHQSPRAGTSSRQHSTQCRRRGHIDREIGKQPAPGRATAAHRLCRRLAIGNQNPGTELVQRARAPAPVSRRVFQCDLKKSTRRVTLGRTTTMPITVQGLTRLWA